MTNNLVKSKEAKDVGVIEGLEIDVKPGRLANLLTEDEKDELEAILKSPVLAIIRRDFDPPEYVSFTLPGEKPEAPIKTCLPLVKVLISIDKPDLIPLVFERFHGEILPRFTQQAGQVLADTFRKRIEFFHQESGEPILNEHYMRVYEPQRTVKT